MNEDVSENANDLVDAADLMFKIGDVQLGYLYMERAEAVRVKEKANG